MSEEINNREYRQKVIRELISELHAGKSVDEVKGRFAAVFEGVSAEEIAQAEQALIANGLPVSEVQRLCDVHAAVFKGSIEEIHKPADPSEIPDHPANTLKRENRAIEKLVDEIRRCFNLPGEKAGEALRECFARLSQIDTHYLKKENLLFPYMEQYGITAPPKVMWGVDDEIRAQIRELGRALENEDASKLKEKAEAVLQKITEMIFKEENIMLPMLLENLTSDDWEQIAEESGEFGYCLIDSMPVWKPVQSPSASEERDTSDTIAFPTGALKREELVHMLDTLPIDITFVDKEDTVKYFSQAAERIFPRTKSVIGRRVENCHPPASVAIVQKIVDDFKTGKKDHEDFWIRRNDQLIYIRYFAVRDEKGRYLGVLEVTQDIAPVQKITGEKRLVSE